MKIDYDMVKELYESGLKDVEIENLTGISHFSMYWWRRRNNLPPNQNHKQSPAELEKLIELYSEGYSDNQIAKELNRQPCVISKWRRKLELAPHFQAPCVIQPEIEVNETDKPWTDPDSLFCSKPEFLETITRKPVKRYTNEIKQ